MEDKNNAQLLQELEALSQTLYQSHTTRRTASLILPRTTAPPLPHGVSAVTDRADDPRAEQRPRSRRMSISPWRSRPKHQPEQDDDGGDPARRRQQEGSKGRREEPPPSPGEKKGIWSWKPMRALSHIGMQRLGCLFSVEVISVQGLPASMNGLRLCVAVRKKETKDGAVQTMPSRVLQGCADFEETLFLRCHVYCSGGSGKPLKFEPRPFLVSTLAIDAPELDFGKSTVDLSLLVRESMEKNLEGARVRQWDRSFGLAGKAKGAEMVLKLGFQIMEDGGVGIYNQPEGGARSGGSSKVKGSSSPFARRHSKSSFSVTSPRISSKLEPGVAPSNESSAVDFRGIDDFYLDEPALAPPSTSPSVQKSKPDAKVEDLDLPEFEVVDKGVEIQGGGREEEQEPAEADEEKSMSSEVIDVKEVVPDHAHRMRMTELDSIAKQIAALESIMARGGGQDDAVAKAVAKEIHGLDADEETVTMEFLQMLELEDGNDRGLYAPSGAVAHLRPGSSEDGDDAEMAFVSDLGKGLGPVVQTKDGGYLAAMNPFNTEVPRKETPKLAMQISKPLVLRDQKSASGFEILQKMAVMGADELSSTLASLAAVDELMGKTAEQIAFEGIASAIISGRNKEGASSSAAKSIAAVKTMASSIGAGRKERILTGIWNVSEAAVAAEDVLAFALQKVEAMAVEALKIQADMTEEEAPFDVFPLAGKGDPNPPLASTMALEEWEGWSSGGGGLTVLTVVQLRDPVRRYETVGGPVVALVQAAEDGEGEEEEGRRFKVGSLHVGGVKGTGGRGGGGWGGGERQRLTAMQWVVANGMGSAGRKKAAGKGGGGRGGGQQQEVMWSMSARVMAGMWLKPVRNPDVKLPRQPQQ
ncbi:hypothetical protein Taro_022704 [Colocasia esculenta]|uniref:C2 NT-type domain-containing protein n=1 Tax=Colocasia esculenta TaxID=4460 RepID=A0A843VC82_COLES|nr:hypothetical protein [Colocasia esculenta]